MPFADALTIALLLAAVLLLAGTLTALKTGLNEIISGLQAIHDTLQRGAGPRT